MIGEDQLLPADWGQLNTRVIIFPLVYFVVLMVVALERHPLAGGGGIAGA